ncbi:MAG: porin [Flavobacteriales bacterium]|nr:porin [Flavobacteriales bacterium]
MYRFRYHWVLALLWLATPNGLSAQNESDERALIEIHDGVTISKDSLFLLNLRFRMQNRIGFTTVSGEDLSVNAVEARVRRLRLRLDGFVMNDRLRYYIQLNFSRQDLDLESDVIAQPVRDAMVYYHFNENLYVGFGQSKLPGNRQRVISSGNLQFPDRSIANSAYTLDRDFGVFGYWTIPIGRQQLQVKGAVSSGDGRGALPINEGMAYTGRMEWLPLGAFANKGDYSEGDLEIETKPKLSIAGGYCYNDRATRTGGQLGPLLYEGTDITTFIADLVFKHKGWSASAEYFNRQADQPISENAEGAIRSVSVGDGFNAQLSRYFRSKYEIASRYTMVRPTSEVAQLRARTDEALLGASRYLNGHRIKLQAYVGYRWIDEQPGFDYPGNSWALLFQVEFGI